MTTKSDARRGSEVAELQEKDNKLGLERENAELRARIAKLSQDPDAARLEQETLKLRLQKENAELQARIAELSRNPETVKLEQETLRLRFENDTSELRAKLLERVQPWWRKSSSVATIAAIIAAVLPITTAVQGWAQKNRELALEEIKHTQNIALEKAKHDSALELERERQSEQLRTAYLERLKTPGEHLRVLRFILATKNDDDKLTNWAQTEKAEVEARLSSIESELKEEEAKYAAAQKAYLDALSSGSGQPASQPRTARQESKTDALKDQLNKHAGRIRDLREEGARMRDPPEHRE